MVGLREWRRHGVLAKFKGARARIFSNKWAAIAQLLNLFAALATLWLWTRYLSTEEIGQFGLAVGTASSLSAIAFAPLQQAIIALYYRHTSSGQGRAFISVAYYKFWLRVLVILAAASVLQHLLLRLLPVNGYVLALLVILVIIEGWRIIVEGTLVGANRQKANAASVFFDAYFRMGCLAIGLHFIGGVDAAIAAYAVGSSIYVVAVSLFLKPETSSLSGVIRGRRFKEIRSDFRTLTTSLLPSQIIMNLTETSGRWVTSLTLGIHAAGLYVLAYSLVKRPYGMFEHMLSITMAPNLTRAISDSDASAISKSVVAWFAMSAAGALIGVAGFALLGKPVTATLMGPEYSEAADLLFLFAIAISVFTLSRPFWWLMVSIGKAHLGLIGTALSLVLSVGLAFAMNPIVGLPGAAISLASGYCALLLVLLAFSLPYLSRLGVAKD